MWIHGMGSGKSPNIQFHANNSTFKVLIFNHPRENFLTYDEKVGRQLIPITKSSSWLENLGFPSIYDIDDHETIDTHSKI